MDKKPGGGQGGQGGQGGPPRRTTTSMPDLSGGAPTRKTTTSMPDLSGGAPTRKTTTTSMPTLSGGAPARTSSRADFPSAAPPRTTTRPNLASDPMDPSPIMNPRATLEAIAAVVVPPAPAKGDGKGEVDPKKVLDSSTFNARDKTVQRRNQLPGVWHGSAAADSSEEVQAHFDGLTPAPELTDRDLWKAIQPPVQSREDRRSADLYAQVINQFAVGNNPRYAPDAPDKPRAHIFVWDVTRAMNAEIPHMLGARELSLVQTIDWLRYESGHRNWVKLAVDRAIEAANEGRPVVIIPKDGKAKPQIMGIVRPGPVGPNGLPRVAAAGKTAGNDLSPQEALGIWSFEYYGHA